MEKLIFILLKGVARLPWGVLYCLSDVVFALMFYVVRYRRKVVADNMRQCFPGRSENELQSSARQFYRNFSDYIFETIKLLHISDADASERMQFENVEIIDRLVSEGRDVVVYFSHCFNWEWAPSVTLHSAFTSNPHVKFCQVYRPLRNKAADECMLEVRSRFGSVSLPKNLTLRKLLQFRRDGFRSVTGFMSDQKPSHGDPTLPLMFLNRPTAFITGTEELARKMKMAAVYWDMYKISRGHYRIVTRLIADDVSTTEQGSVTRTYAAMLQETIQRNPPIWLWTHKRWKIPVTIPTE